MSIRDFTSTLRARAPEPVVRALRGGAETFGTVTAPWRMTPGFLVVGAQRAGTTTMFRLLSEHPSVARPTASKGIGYFDLNYHRGQRWYRGHFPLATLALLQSQGQRTTTFESSGYYLFHPLAAERIAADLPSVKVIAMVRDPVDRAYSAHSHELARGFETEPFEKAVDLEPSRTAGEQERLIADPSYRSFEHRHHAYLARGRYAEQIERYLAALGHDRVLIVDADAFFADPAAQFVELCERLGLAPWRPERVERWNARPRETMAPALRTRLMDYFAPHDERLAQLMGRTPSWRNRAG